MKFDINFGPSVCGWVDCRSCLGASIRKQAGVASVAARAAVMRWPGWGRLSCDERRTLALAFDKFKTAKRPRVAR